VLAAGQARLCAGKGERDSEKKNKKRMRDRSPACFSRSSLTSAAAQDVLVLLHQAGRVLHVISGRIRPQGVRSGGRGGRHPGRELGVERGQGRLEGGGAVGGGDHGMKGGVCAAAVGALEAGQE